MLIICFTASQKHFSNVFVFMDLSYELSPYSIEKANSVVKYMTVHFFFFVCVCVDNLFYSFSETFQ